MKDRNEKKYEKIEIYIYINKDCGTINELLDVAPYIIHCKGRNSFSA